MPKTRAERKRQQGKSPTKRSMKGAQQTARRDPETGVTSRARKRRQGTEMRPDPSMGARSGRPKSKWRPELQKARQAKRGMQKAR